MNPQDKLVLKDIHTPLAPSWWPPAPGWWIVAAALLAVIAVWMILRNRRRRRREAAMRIFDDSIDNATTAPAQIATMSELLRRAARHADPSADRLHGEDWLRFLDKDQPLPVFAAGAGRTLLEGGFRRDVGAAELEALRTLTRVRFASLMQTRLKDARPKNARVKNAREKNAREKNARMKNVHVKAARSKDAQR